MRVDHGSGDFYIEKTIDIDDIHYENSWHTEDHDRDVMSQPRISNRWRVNNALFIIIYAVANLQLGMVYLGTGGLTRFLPCVFSMLSTVLPQ